MRELRIILRHRSTGQFYGDAGTWEIEASKAHIFKSGAAAQLFAMRLGEPVEMVYDFGFSDCDLTALPFAQPNSHASGIQLQPPL